MGQHDLSYRSFFAHRRMIQDLLREIVGDHWVEQIDFASGECIAASFVSPRHENCERDVIWEFQRQNGGPPVYVYIVLEFHSRPDLSMSVRLFSHENLFYQSLLASQQAASSWRKVPLVIPVLVCTWSQEVILPRPCLGGSQKEVPVTLTLEELETMLAESIDRWDREIREEGRREGRQSGS